MVQTLSDDISSDRLLTFTLALRPWMSTLITLWLWPWWLWPWPSDLRLLMVGMMFQKYIMLQIFVVCRCWIIFCQVKFQYVDVHGPFCPSVYLYVHPQALYILLIIMWVTKFSYSHISIPCRFVLFQFVRHSILKRVIALADRS